MAHTRTGAAATPTTQVANKAQARMVATALINSCVASSPCWLRVAASKGTKAWEKAPSANKRRKRFGMRNATLKASVAALAPKLAAISCSRNKPVTLETRVSRDTVEAALSRFTERWRYLGLQVP